MRRIFDKLFPPKPCMKGGWWEQRFRGHWMCGPVTVYGWNAMHIAINIRMFGTYVCFHPTVRVSGYWWPWYFYISPNATPWAATIGFGPGYEP